MTSILGVSAFYHDSAAALVVDGKVVAAAQEERFTRKKYDERFPVHAIEFCLKQAGIEAGQLDYVAFYDKPFLKFQRLLETYLAYAPAGFRSFCKAMPVWINQKLHLTREMNRGLNHAYRKRYIFTQHHESHAASAFFPSPFDEAAILTLDGVGEWATASIARGEGNRIAMLQEQQFPHSLGLLYSAFTYYCGFAVNSGEYKLMGLAPYGAPRYVDLILDKMLDLKADGSFRLDMSYFNYCQGLTMTSEKFHRLFGGPPRPTDALLTERDMDVAASIQKVTEEIVLRTARHAHDITGSKKLCMAGGVALNCVANGRLLREGPFEDLWIQPAAGDAGGALGAALFVWHQLLGKPRVAQLGDSQSGSLLGPSFSGCEIQKFLDKVQAAYQRIDDEQELVDRVACEISQGRVIGWFQGRMEYGPRALGSRSLLGDPRNPDMQTVMNVKVKFREGFRPFAPAVLREQAAGFFELPGSIDSPYMLLVAPVRQDKRNPLSADQQRLSGIAKLKVRRSQIPAVTHVDYSARIQTVDRQRHGIYHRLLESFHRLTGCPVIVNTSFNLGWDPIVCTPEQAYSTFMASDIDVLCMGPFLIHKRAQRAWVEEGRAGQWDDGLFCPCGSGAPLARRGAEMVAEPCRHRFPITDGVPQLYWPHDGAADPNDVTGKVKAFYEETPFPNYDEHESLRSLIEKARRGEYARQLDQAIPYNASVLEVGCGTGQLSNFLGISCRRVTGGDLCLNSLRLGEKFRRSHHLSRVRFLQMNLFRPPFSPEEFDVVLCNGVLHHTSAPRQGFLGLAPLVRPGGYIVIGLYNKFGRLATDLRRAVFRATKGAAKSIDPYLRSVKMSAEKRRAWFADQYLHPHESKHTVGEVLQWFQEAGLEFVRGVPAVTRDSHRNGAGLFSPSAPGTRWDHFVTQSRQIVTGSREGGFFVMIGRKPES
ncbi:MAG TPA: carbamoyltransferase N-terminal domain-containing protein [Bryobacteraceae bacterium]|nr:carbamoyltransferase N-terminal domain-containing protein [Bryobacteraceae bacterium]